MEKTVSGLCHSPSDVLVDEPELGSQAVLDWYMFGEAEGNNCYRSTYKKSDVKEKAKKHLLAMGWKFWYGQKGSRRELRYTSPNGKCFYSLRMACKGYFDQQGGVSQSTIVGSKKTDQCVSSNSLATTDGFASTSCQMVVSDSLSETETFTSGSVCETVVASNSPSTIETLASSSSCQRVVSDPLSITDAVACDSVCQKDASDSCKPVQSLVGTRYQYRRCGMCQTLMNELEKQLMVLGVEKLILPAAQGVLKTWTTSFRFSEMTDFERSQLLDYTFLDFQDTIMCQKFLMKNPGAEIVDQGLVDSAASHGKSNSECLVEEANFQKASSSNSRDYSKFYKRRKISACESQSIGYSIDTGEERFEPLRPEFHSMTHSVDILSPYLILF